MAVSYKLDKFEGPLDLLLHLIDEAEVDIYDIPISQITDQYMTYLDEMKAFELEAASEFLVMAATLLALKSRLLLPKPPRVLEDEEAGDEGEDPRAELVRRLLEYRKYKSIAQHLREKELQRSLIFTRAPADLTPYIPKVKDNPVLGIHVADLVLAFRRVLQRTAKKDTVTRIRRDEISVKDRIREVYDYLGLKGGRVLFSRLFAEELDREMIVVTFLAVLELMKMKKVSCYQHSLFDDIVIQRRKEDDSDTGLSADEIDY